MLNRSGPLLHICSRRFCEKFLFWLMITLFLRLSTFYSILVQFFYENTI